MTPFNPFSPEFARDPYAVYARLRAETRPARTVFGSWVLSRADQIEAVLRDRRFGHGSSMADSLRLAGWDRPESALTRLLGRIMVVADPPFHQALRRPLAKTFTARRVELLRPRIAAEIAALMADHGERFDLVAQLAWPLPTRIICDMLGIPEDERAPFLAGGRVPSGLLEPTPKSIKELARLDEDVAYLFETFRALCARKRERPEDDLCSELVALAWTDPDPQEALLDLYANLIFLFSAGHETTAHLIGNALKALIEAPDQWARLRVEPALFETAIDELMRYDTSVQITQRICLSATEIGGQAFQPGERLLLLLGSANRDPERFPEPDRLDLSRPVAANLSFGAGPHICLGAPLARLQLELCLRDLLARVPALALDGPAPGLRRLALRGLERLPVSVVAAPC